MNKGRDQHILVVYHDPGIRNTILEEKLREKLKTLNLRLVRLTDALQNRCYGVKLVALLSPYRGGHWATLCRTCGCRVYAIPPGIICKCIARHAIETNTLTILYHGPRSPSTTFSEDMEELVTCLTSMGFRVTLSTITRPYPSLARYCCIVPLVLLPGKLYNIACELAKLVKCPVAPPLASYCLDDIVSWLKTLLEKS